MDKKTIPFIVLCVALIFFWKPILDFIWPSPPVRPATAQATNQTAVAGAEAKTVAGPDVAALPPAPSLLRTGEGSTNAAPVVFQTLEDPRIRVEFTSEGGGIHKITLKDFSHSARPDDRKKVVLNELSPLPAMAVGVGDLDFHTPYQLASASNQVRAVAQSSSGLRLVKEFRITSDYQIEAVIRLSNTGRLPLATGPLKVALGMSVPLGAPGPIDYVAVSGCSAGKAFHETSVALRKFAEKQRRIWERTQSLDWAAVKNQYFAFLVTPSTPFAGLLAEAVPLPPAEDAPPSKLPPEGVLGVMVSPAFELSPGASTNWTFHLYAGPKEYKRLAALGMQQDQVLGLGMFEIFAKALLWLLDIFHGVFGNWGVAIIAVTVIIKVFFWPLTAMSTRSMKQMQALAPKMNALKEKYKDDSKKLNEEMMKMYRDYKVNPMAGCLPMLIQIPIFFAFYTMLRTAIELRGASFLWISDLSMADTVARIPVMGWPVNLMPLLMAATMIWQTRITPQAPNADPSMKMMMWMMPAMFLFFCYNYSSGLSLYWTVQNLLTVLQTYLTRDRPVAPPQKIKIRKGFSFMRPADPKRK